VQLPLSQHAQSGYCSRCNSWLGSLPQGEAGESLAFEDKEWAWQLWIVHSVGDLLSAAPALTDAPQRERILFTIDIYAEKLTRGQRVTLFHQLECNSSIENWFYKTQTLQLSHLLHFCFRLGASPLQLLLGNIEEAAIEKHTPVDMPTKRYWKFDEERIQQMLEAILKSEGSSPSMEEVARQLGYKYRQIYKRFPELCRAISAKYMASPIFTKTVQVTLGVTRSITIQQQCRRFDSERVLQALESALQISEGDPPSMTTVAKDLGYYPGYIRKHFPELCRAISKRYKEAQAAKGVQRVQLICTNVKEIVFAIHKQGRYPSKRQVSKYLKNRAVLREREVLCAWKEAVQELGWEQQDLSVPG